MEDVFGSAETKYFGMRLEVPVRNLDLYQIQGYENYSSVLYFQMCKSADLVIDVGAYIGYYSLLARLASQDAKVIAVEPSLNCQKILELNTVGRNIDIYRGALGSGANSSTFYEFECSEKSSLSPNPDSTVKTKFEIEWIRGSSLVKNSDTSTVIKIDVEGHELDALHSFESSLIGRSNVRLFVAFNPRSLKNADQDPNDVLKLINTWGYRLFLIDDENWQWEEIDSEVDWHHYISDSQYANIYCVPKSNFFSIGSVLHSSSFGGAEICEIELADDLISRGCMMHIFIPRSNVALSNRLNLVGASVSVYQVNQWWLRFNSKKYRFKFSDFKNFIDFNLVDTARHLKLDVLHTQTSTIVQASIAALLLKKKHVWSIHEFGDLDHGLGFPNSKSFFSKVVFSLSHAISVNSLAVRNHLFKDDSKIHLVYPNPKANKANPKNRQVRHSWNLGIVGTQNPGKGHVDLINALAVLKSKGIVLTVRFVGSKSLPYSDYLQQQIELNGLENQFEFCENVTDQEDIYDQLDVVAVCSRMEAFGRVPFEAAARNIPVIYPFAGGIQEYMEDNVTGLGYQPGNYHDLSEKIEKLLLDDNTYQRISLDGSRLLLKKMNDWKSGEKNYQLFKASLMYDHADDRVLVRILRKIIKLSVKRHYERHNNEF